MKVHRWLLALLVCALLSGGAATPAEGARATERPAEPVRIANLADPESRSAAEAALLAALPRADVEAVLAAADDYNRIVGAAGLARGFDARPPDYDMAKIGELWRQEKGDRLGVNCRITAFTLLKGALRVPDGPADEALLFLDRDAIEEDGRFSPDERARFMRLFSRVKTERTQDVRVHAERMRAHLSGVQFPDSAKMVSVVIHDILDGDWLFIGHVGVLVRGGDGYLFIEKLSFEEPYQAVRCAREEDCWQYLLDKYAGYADEGAAPPFIMVNGEYAAGGAQP